MSYFHKILCLPGSKTVWSLRHHQYVTRFLRFTSSVLKTSFQQITKLDYVKYIHTVLTSITFYSIHVRDNWSEASFGKSWIYPFKQAKNRWIFFTFNKAKTYLEILLNNCICFTCPVVVSFMIIFATAEAV